MASASLPEECPQATLAKKNLQGNRSRPGVQPQPSGYLERCGINQGVFLLNAPSPSKAHKAASQQTIKDGKPSPMLSSQAGRNANTWSF
jgi:hypothetical protein